MEEVPGTKRKPKPGSLPNAERGILIVGALSDAAIPNQEYGRYQCTSGTA